MLFRKLFRTAWKYKAQFISMIIMVSIGMGVFVGFNMEWYSLDKDTESFYTSTDYADYRIYNEQGFSEEDIEKILEIDGVDSGSRVLNVNVGVKDSDKSLGLFSSENYTVSKMVITEGKSYDENSDGFWLSDKYANENNIKIGDTLTVTYRNFEISGEVVGLCKSAEYLICVADENQLMPDYTSFGFVYASPKKIESVLGFTFYPQINIKSDLDKEEIEEKINATLNKTTLVLSKSEHMSYAGVQSEIEEGKTMGSILPVLFLLIGILTMITTMHRITANEKTQIGTLKALGFKDRTILAHYTSYGFVIGLIGCIVGIGLGYGIAYMVVSPNGMESTYMDLPSWKLYVPWFCTIALAVTVILLTLISFLSVKNMLKGTASDALRPYTPKNMKSTALEKTRLWNKFSFATRWNLRDIFRHKSRTIMTLIGIWGCMVLLVGGLGMKDTMASYLDVIDSKIFNYTTRINIVENADNDEVVSFAESVDGDYLASSSVQLNSKAVSLDIYDITHDKIRFIDKNNDVVTIGDDGVYICIRLADSGINVGDIIQISPYGTDKTYSVKVAGVIRSVLTENITMTKNYAEKMGIEYSITSVFTDTPQGEIETKDFISGMQSKENLMSSYDSFMEIMDTMVWLLVVAAVVLGIVVLYNLGIMSYMERYRELATLKVLGFKDKRIGNILISQNIWLTVLGIIIGLPSGIATLYVLIVELASEYELKTVVGVSTFVISIVLTFGVSLLVGLLVSKKNKNIDMVEALKGTE